MHLRFKLSIVLLLLISGCLITGCSVIANNTNNLATFSKKDQLETLLFSNNTSLDLEKNYYNALLDIQQDFPNEINTFEIIFESDNEELMEDYKVNTYPTLIIINHGEILLRIEGKQAQHDIYQKIKNVYKK